MSAGISHSVLHESHDCSHHLKANYFSGVHRLNSRLTLQYMSVEEERF